MADIPRVKVHEDGRIAIRPGRPGVWLVGVPGRTENVYHGDADVSGPGWRDAAVVPLVEPSDFHASDIPVFRMPDGSEAYVGPLDGSEIQMASVYASAAAWAERQEGVAEDAVDDVDQCTCPPDVARELRGMDCAADGSGYIVIVQQIVGSLESWTTTYDWDGSRHSSHNAAIAAGLADLEHDDFNIGRIENDRLVWFGWQYEQLPDEDLDEIARQLSLRGGPEVGDG